MNKERYDKGQSLRAAANVGVTQDDVREVFMQAAGYCRIPAALDSFRVAEGVFVEQGKPA